MKLRLEKTIKIKKAYFLGDETKVKVKRENENVTLELPASLPDEEASVLVLELNKTTSEIEPYEL